MTCGVQSCASLLLFSPPSPCSVCSAAYEPEIGDVNEGVVLDAVSIRLESIRAMVCCLRSWRRCGQLRVQLSATRSTIANLGRGHPPPKTSSPSRTWGPREMFSCAGRAVFLGAILTVIRWSWDFAVVVLRMHHSTGRLQNFDGCGENCPTEAGGEGPQKAGQSEIPGSSPKCLRPVPHFSTGTWSFFSSPPSEFSFLIFRELDHPATAVKSTNRKDGSHVCLTPIPFLPFLNGVVARHLTGVCRLA
jgi:hypothetical protein